MTPGICYTLKGERHVPNSKAKLAVLLSTCAVALVLVLSLREQRVVRECSRRHWSQAQPTQTVPRKHPTFQTFRFNVLNNTERMLSSTWNNIASSNVSGPIHKTNGLAWFKYRDICVTGNDTLRYQKERELSFQKSLAELDLLGVTRPYKSSPIDFDIFRDTDVYRVRGKTLLVQCWRSPGSNPSHFMIAYGKLFAFCIHKTHPPVFQNVVFFQCPDPFAELLSDDDSNFLQSMARMVLNTCVQNKHLNHATKLFSTPLGPNDEILCVDEAWVDHSIHKFLGPNDDYTIKAWRGALRTLISERQLLSSSSSIPNYESRVCPSKKRIAIFQRLEGTSLRRFSNIQDVIDLALQKSPLVQLITVSSSTRFWDALQTFNSFDVLITPHGSHMINSLLTFHNPSIIEVVGTCFNLDWPKALNSFTSSYEISSHHEVVGLETQVEELNACNARQSCYETSECPLKILNQVIHSNLRVNITSLGQALERALQRIQC
jgi:hypothetical protein